MAFAMGVAKYVPPPTITETAITALAHCPDPRCKGVQQQPVQATRTLVEWTFASRGGGDDPGGIGNMFNAMIENAQTHLRFTDPADLACPHCGKPRELSDQDRPSYPIQVGGANALLRLQELGIQFDPERQEQIQKGAPETPLELLQRRYISDEITETEFLSKQATIGGTAALPAQDAAADDRIAVLEAQIARLLGSQDVGPAAKRGPGRPENPPRED